MPMSEVEPWEDPEEDLTLFVPLEFELPKPIIKCQKCGSKASMKTYHATGFLEGVCGRTLGLAAISRLGQHMDKTCIVCGNQWCERIAEIDEEE